MVGVRRRGAGVPGRHTGSRRYLPSVKRQD